MSPEEIEACEEGSVLFDKQNDTATRSGRGLAYRDYDIHLSIITAVAMFGPFTAQPKPGIPPLAGQIFTQLEEQK